VPIPHGLDIGQSIAGHDGKAADECVRPDPAELMDGGKRSYDGVILYPDMAGKGSGIGHDDVIADMRVVGYVAVGHEEAVISHGCDSPAPARPAVHGHELAEHVSLAHAQDRLLALVFQVLRIAPDRAETIEAAIFADRGPAVDLNVRVENGI